jgi:hypothetical protein
MGTTVGSVIPNLLSQGKPVTVSSTSTATNYAPEKGNNGVTDGTSEPGWAAATDNFATEFWRVDLGAVYPLSRVVMYWPNGRTVQYRIEVSNDDVTYTTAVNKSANTTATITTDNFSASGRYVRVKVTGITSGSSPKIKFLECRVYKGGTPPTAGNLVLDQVTANSIRLTWTDNSSTESGFKIERKTGAVTGSAYTEVATVGANVTTFTETGLAAGTQYFYRVRPYSDSDGDALDPSNSPSATTSTAGSFTRQYWTGITGNAVSNLTSNANFPNTPSGSQTLNTFEAPFNWGDNYGDMTTGMVVPPTTGDYTFWIASKNTSELWLSTDNSSANAVLIAKVEDRTSPRDWKKHSTQKSAPISLVGGQSYYIKALRKEGTSSSSAGYYPDHLAVAWEGPGFSRQVLADTGLTLAASLTSPTDGTEITEGSNVTLEADAAAPSGRSIVKVEFLLYGDTEVEAKLGEDASAPYTMAWNNVTTGTYTLTARAWDNLGISTSSTVKVKVVNSSFGSGAWTERILNGDGSINWTEYVNVANNYGSREMASYRFGPSYKYFHPTPETFPTRSKQTSESGVLGYPYIAGSESDWYSEGGQLVYSPNATAPANYQPGVSLGINGDIYLFLGRSPEYTFINGIHWTSNQTMDISHGQSTPDPSVKQTAFKAASGGSVPPAIATVRTGALGGISGFLLFQNGLITAAGNGATDAYGSVPGDLPRYGFTQLAPGKVPTAGAVTLNTEFLLVTVWDTINHKGQLAVIAVNGQIRAQQSALANHQMGEYMWGLPNRFTVRSLKVLGYVDLPVNAPMAIKVSNDMAQKDGVGANDNTGLPTSLNSQAERDVWYNWGGSNNHYNKTAKSGYAVISSRAENKVTFIDLQPLFEYYRQMYFTTQANYDLTKNQGTAANQWPFTFSHAPVQAPTIYDTIDVTAPTTLWAGMPQNPNGGGGTTDSFKSRAYIGTMDGQLLVYNVGDLMTTASGGSIGSPIATVPIGKNPTSIDMAMEFSAGSIGIVNCRGDKKIHRINSDGTVLQTLTDSRLDDPVYTAVSHNGRQIYGLSLMHVMDFEGNQIMTYRYGGTTSSIPVALPQDEIDNGITAGFEFLHADPMPGCPFMYTRCGVN